MVQYILQIVRWNCGLSDSWIFLENKGIVHSAMCREARWWTMLRYPANSWVRDLRLGITPEVM